MLRKVKDQSINTSSTQIIGHLQHLPVIERGVATIGMFDGIHLGHREIFDQVKEQADRQSAASVVITFLNHPLSLLKPEIAPPMLRTLDYKIQFLKNIHIDYLVVLEFSPQFAELSARQFLELLCKKFDLLTLVQGYNFKFGKGNEGNIAYLREQQSSFSLKLHEIPCYEVNGNSVSSSAIRRLISQGNVASANQLLGDDFYIPGRVIEGEKLGQTIGFPTINIRNENLVFPLDGVYQSQVLLGDSLYNSMTYVGRKLADYNQQGRTANKLIETHLFDFDQMIYGQDVFVRFKQWIRAPKHFDDINKLKTQLQIDKVQCLGRCNHSA